MEHDVPPKPIDGSSLWSLDGPPGLQGAWPITHDPPVGPQTRQQSSPSTRLNTSLGHTQQRFVSTRFCENHVVTSVFVRNEC